MKNNFKLGGLLQNNSAPDQAVRDERVLAQRRRIQSDAYGLLIYCLTIAILVQQFVFHAPLAQYAVELFLLCGSGVYMGVRHWTAGVDIWGAAAPARRIVVSCLAAGALCLVFFYFLSDQRDPLFLALFFLAFTACFILLNLVLRRLSQRKQQRINAQLDQDED